LRIVTGRIEVPAKVRERIADLASQSEDGRETGGILLGRGPGPTGEIQILDACDAGPEAIRRADFFLRDLNHARVLAEKAWRDSRAVWVGEWHTHLAGDGRPSGADLRTYAGLLASAGLEFEAFVSIIAIADPEQGWRDPRLCPWVLTALAPARRRAEPDTQERPCP
jgi:integrative and conjugative element protein (TIGR02256 family)